MIDQRISNSGTASRLKEMWNHVNQLRNSANRGFAGGPILDNLILTIPLP